MLRTSLCLTTMLLAIARGSAGQGIASTVTAAEAEGETFPRAAAPTTVSFAFKGAAGGTPERRCVPMVSGGSTPSGSLRSGDFIIRSELLWGAVAQANRGYKVLWLPVHNPYEYRDTLLVRAARVGHPTDSVRTIIADWAWEAGAPKTDSGFPSGVSFPAPGQWVIVATAGSDWGCFLLTVTP